MTLSRLELIGIVVAVAVIGVVLLNLPYTTLPTGQAANPVPTYQSCVCGCYRVTANAYNCTTSGGNTPQSLSWGTWRNKGESFALDSAASYAESTRGTCPKNSSGNLACEQTCTMPDSELARLASEESDARASCIDAGGTFSVEDSSTPAFCQQECANNGQASAS